MMWRWREDFRQDPEKAIANLFSGRAGLGAAQRRDLPEILYHEFPDHPDQVTDRERLDSALLAWLEMMRRNYRHEIERLDFDAYGKRLCDALRALQLLDLPRSSHHIREVHGAWLRWLDPLRLAPERDPALESWRLLTRRQPENAGPASWMQLAASHRQEYLTVALLGLQRLAPRAGERNERDNQVLMVAALLHHFGQAPGDINQRLGEYRRHLAALRVRYPRGPAHWQEVVETAVAAAGNGGARRLSEFLEQLRSKTAAEHLPAQARTRPSRRPSKQEKDRTLQAIEDRRQVTEVVSRQYLALVQRCLDYAQHTGDSGDFVRTLCNHGRRLLDRPDLSSSTLATIGAFTEEALRWEPLNAYNWTFWAHWLAYQEREEHQRWVLREAVRLFPDYEHSRVELARLLIRQGQEHWPEAEQWLRQTAERNPDGEHSRDILAKLLAMTGQRQEGMELLRAFTQDHPDNPIIQITLQRLEAGDVDFGLDRLDEEVEQTQPNLPAHSVPDQRRLVPAHAQRGEAEILTTLRTRASTQEDFALARFASADVGPIARLRLVEAAADGDALAGLYGEWLDEDFAVAPPPNAWSWRTAHCFRIGTNDAAWEDLEQLIPDQRTTTRFVRWLAQPDAGQGELARDIDAQLSRARPSDDEDPVQHFVLRSWQALRTSPAESTLEKRREVALSILQAKAEPSLAF